MKRRPLLLAALLTLSALLSACLPTPLRTQPGSALTLSARLDDALKVADGEYRRPGPAQLQVDAGLPGSFLYALLLPDQSLASAAPAQLLTPRSSGEQSATFNLPPEVGFTQVFVVGSPRPLTFPALGRSVGQLSDALKAATADLTPGSWNVTTQVYRVGDYGQLRVLSSPSDANVYLGGTYRGRTPLDLSAVPAGDVALRIERQNYVPLTRTVTVHPDQTAGLKVALRPQPAVGHLTVQSSLPAQVQVLGNRELGNQAVRGPTPLSADLLAGDYALTVTPLNSPLKAAWLGLTLTRNQTVNVSCAPEGEQLVCRTQ
ncbi:PEGA domain-containing protein [Deinococcus alpinitundrae]|uniref:PEGA domain-containing protein n=1 Tax=Deinococcus alpinitundrae TaxID=468913 RepID=UPI00137AC3CD|nr:PEGA domain-containing protein [Deinococcus alpinitundrae]